MKRPSLKRKAAPKKAEAEQEKNVADENVQFFDSSDMAYENLPRDGVAMSSGPYDPTAKVVEEPKLVTGVRHTKQDEGTPIVEGEDAV